MPKVLVVATSRKTRGGITSVVKAHETGPQWKKFHCRWIQTHRDGNAVRKLWYLCTALVQYVCLLPFYDVVHIHVSEPVSAFRKCFFFSYAKVFKKKIIIHFHAFSPETTVNSRYRKVYNYLFGKADVVIVLSQLWKKYVNNIFNLGEKVWVVYNPCTTEVSGSNYTKKNRYFMPVR